MKLVLALVALLVLVVILQDAFEVMLLPRRIRRGLRFASLFFRTTWRCWSALAKRIRSDDRREQMLGLYGPLSMLLLFSIWAVTLIAAFGVLAWALQPPVTQSAPLSSITEQIYMSGVTFFTLGYGDVVPHSSSARALSVIEAGTGLGFIAVVIGYLPVLYQFFSRRDAHVIQLDGRAGSPPTATAMLCRHADDGRLDQLNVALRDWEVWSAELLESHLSYPMLAYYRSQHHNQSWLTALACIMDACSLVLVGTSMLPPLQARMTFTMARQVLVEMSQSFGIRPSRYDGGDRLGQDGYQKMVETLTKASLTWDNDPETEHTLAALRATYEPLMDGLARYLLLAVPKWVPSDDATDHWEGGHRGMIARRLVEELSDRQGRGSTLSGMGVDERPWRKLRRRLKDD
jgi:hypothetical protein